MNINSINVNKYPISQMFDSDSKVVYMIPKYQREYVWGNNHWTALYDDLFENSEGYFLGTIICINSSEDSLNPRFEVVDGQQRLTTISLYLAALYNLLVTYKDQLDEEQQADLLQLKRKLVLKKPSESLRVIPQVQNYNYDDYCGLMASIGIIPHHQMQNYYWLRRIIKCYNYFRDRIKNDIKDSVDKIKVLYQLLEKINSAILVMIEVSNHADAYTLFESLNDRGMPLTAVDLIKNLLLARLDPSAGKDLDYYFDRWNEVLGNLGDDYSVQERFFRQNYNAFRRTLNDPFRKVDDDRVYPLGPIATRTSLMDIYQKLVSRDPKKFLDEIISNSYIYASIILKRTENLSSEIKDSLLDLQRVQGAPSYLLLMYLMKNADCLKIDDHETNRVIRLLVNFFIRRNLTDVPPTRDLTRLFMLFIEDIEKNNDQGNLIFENLRKKLISVSASDDAFSERLHGPVYIINSGACRFILCMIAKEGMTRDSEVDLWKKNENNQYVSSIEHIFPQGANIPDPWVDMIADGDREKAKELQAQYVHCFGNLTITGYNSTLGNKSFEEKKKRVDSKGRPIGYNNGLNLNADVVNQNKWTVECIKERTESMVEHIISMFAL